MNFQPLSGMDAGFLYMENPTLHMHTLKVAILRPSEFHGGFSFDEFRTVLARKLARLPAFGQRLMEVPFGLGHPVWVRDDDFDMSRHLLHFTASAPGKKCELNAIVSEIASTALPRDRPLWQISMVDGLESGRIAFICKLHHSMADGSAVMAMLLKVLTKSAEEVEQRPRESTFGLISQADATRSRAPNKWEITRWAGSQALRRIGSLPRLMLQTSRGLLALVRRSRDGQHPHLPAPFSGPRTPWSGPLSARRSFATITLSLAAMKRAKNVLGVTLNDVFLGICGGALRSYLEDVAGSIPEKALVASVPINTHPNSFERTRGNHVGHLTASLFTQIVDPVERIHSIHALTDEAKQRQMALGADLMERWFEYTPPRPYAAAVRLWSRWRMAKIVPAPINLVVSNVAGPKESLAIGGNTLEALYSVGPILEGAGLNITGWSYGDQVCLVGLACPDQIPDIQGLIDRLPSALAEVLRACEPSSVERPPELSSLPVDEAQVVERLPGSPLRRVRGAKAVEDEPDVSGMQCR